MRLAHLSDLHFGKSDAVNAAARHLRAELDRQRVDHALVTGDITHNGLRRELEQFHAVFGDLLQSGRLTAVPGNHDRLGDDVASVVRQGPRVQTVELGGVEVVCIDSTSEHNDTRLMPHGELDEFDLVAIERAIGGLSAPVRLAMLHHHPMRLPEDSLVEWLATRLAITQSRELSRGAQFCDLLMGSISVVLFGHRHVPRHLRLERGDAVLDLYNAGSSTELGTFRVLDF